MRIPIENTRGWWYNNNKELKIQRQLGATKRTIPSGTHSDWKDAGAVEGQLDSRRDELHN